MLIYFLHCLFFIPNHHHPLYLLLIHLPQQEEHPSAPGRLNLSPLAFETQFQFQPLPSQYPPPLWSHLCLLAAKGRSVFELLLCTAIIRIMSGCDKKRKQSSTHLSWDTSCFRHSYHIRQINTRLLVFSFFVAENGEIEVNQGILESIRLHCGSLEGHKSTLAVVQIPKACQNSNINNLHYIIQNIQYY